jgi:hypothetical protein
MNPKEAGCEVWRCGDVGWIPSVQDGTHSLDFVKMVMNHWVP